MFATIEARPVIGYLSAAGGFVSWLLTLIHVLTPILGFAGALFGAIAGFITLLIKWREFKNTKKNEN